MLFTPILPMIAPHALSISPTTMGAMTDGDAVSVSFTAGGFPAGTVVWSISAGTLPSGLSLNTSTGVISGTVSQYGSYSFTLKVVDSWGEVGTRALSGTIAAVPALAYIGSNQSNSSGATQTFSGQSIGAAAADRVVLVAVMGFGPNGASITGVTINGVSATNLVSKIEAATNVSTVAIYGLLVTAGTTANIVVNYSTSSAPRVGISVYALTGTSGVATPTDTATAGSNSSTTLSPGTLSISHGLVLAVAAGNVNFGTAGISWSVVTEDFQTSFSSAVSVGSTAHETGAGSSPSPTATLNQSPGSDGWCVAVAGW